MVVNRVPMQVLDEVRVSFSYLVIFYSITFWRLCLLLSLCLFEVPNSQLALHSRFRVAPFFAFDVLFSANVSLLLPFLLALLYFCLHGLDLSISFKYC